MIIPLHQLRIPHIQGGLCFGSVPSRHEPFDVERREHAGEAGPDREGGGELARPSFAGGVPVPARVPAEQGGERPVV